MELCFLWIFQQIFCPTPIYSLLHSLPYHTYICKSLHFSVVWYLYPWGVVGVPWLYCLLWNTFLCHVSFRCYCGFHSILSYRAPLCRVYSSWYHLDGSSYICFVSCFWCLSYSKPMLGICNCWVLYWGDLLPPSAVICGNRLSWPCV